MECGIASYSSLLCDKGRQAVGMLTVRHNESILEGRKCLLKTT